MGACGPEHADGSMHTGRCNRKVRKRIIICFVVCLRTRYLYGYGIMQTGTCKREHVDVRVRMGARGQEHCDRSNFFLTIYLKN